jgi:ABC-type Mn2+/Zn2+ transport system permease subunit
MIELLTEPFEYGFMRRALAAVTLAAINCALIGVYVVLRRMAFLGGALSHTILPGVVLAYMKGFSLFLGALGASLITALGVGWLARRRELREDTAIGVVLSGMFALGVLMMGFATSYRDFSTILFGSILGVEGIDLLLIGAVTGVVVLVLGLLHKELELSSYDSDYGLQLGMRPALLRLVILCLTALSVVSAVRMVGALLTTALLITPAAAACLLARDLKRIMVIATAIAVVSGWVGLYLSYFYESIAPGAGIVLATTLFFALAWLWRTWREHARMKKNNLVTVELRNKNSD